MKFCTKCGKEVKEGQTFCTSCGNDLTKDNMDNTKPIETIDPIKENIAPNTTPSTTPNFKLTKRSKIVIAVVAVLILIIVGIVQVGNYLSDPKKLEARFQNDIATNNSSDLASIMECSDTRLIVDSKNIAPLLSYFKSHPSYYDEVIQNLNNDVLSPKNRNNTLTSNTLTLTNIGKRFLIFPNYKISIKPAFVDITTPVKDVTFSINNAQIGKSDTDKSAKEFGPYIPGDYNIVANYKGKYVSLNKSYPVDLVAVVNGIEKLSVFDDMNYLNITSDFPDAKLFVNGKDVNVAVKDATNFGPVDSSTKIYAVHIIDGKTLKSEEYSVTNGETNVNISFQDASNALNNVQSQLDDLLGYYTSYFTEAINTNNFSLIEPYITYGSELYKQQQSYIPSTYAAGIYENAVSAKITDYSISDDSKSGSITTSEVYTIMNKDGISSNKAFKYVYKFQYNVDTASYQLTSIHS